MCVKNERTLSELQDDLLSCSGEPKNSWKVKEVCKVTGGDWLVEVRVVVTERRRRGSCQASPRESATVMPLQLPLQF